MYYYKAHKYKKAQRLVTQKVRWPLYSVYRNVYKRDLVKN